MSVQQNDKNRFIPGAPGSTTDSWPGLKYWVCISYNGVGLKSCEKLVDYIHDTLAIIAFMGIASHTGHYYTSPDSELGKTVHDPPQRQKPS